MKRRLFFVNRFFHPDESATSQILSQLAEHLAAEGFDVTVITSRLDYSDTATRHAKREEWNGVKIRRVATTGFGRAGLAGRAIDYLSFYVTSFFCALSLVGRGDILIAKTDPPLISIPMGLVARFKGARFMNWLQDLFPEVAIALNVNPPLPGLLTWLRDQSLKRAETNIAIGQKMRDKIVSRGVAKDNVKIIHNFVRDDMIVEDPEGAARLRNEWGFAPDDYVVGYSGNLGRAHDFETILGAAEQLSNDPKIKFLFVGGGHLRAQVEAEAEKRGLQSLVFRPYQPHSELAASLSVPNLHWVSLRPEMEGLIVPSKLYGIAAVGRPLLMIGQPDGEIGRVVSEYGFGQVFPLNEKDNVAEAIRELRASTSEAAEESQRAKMFMQAEGTKSLALSYWTDLLDAA